MLLFSISNHYDDDASCVTPAGTSNELDVQNEWEENIHTHTVLEREAHINWSMVTC